MTGIPLPRLAAGTTALVSGVALALAFIAQYGFDLWPCLWCFRQRVPYALTLGLGLLCLMPAVDTKMMRHAIMLCALLFLINAGVATYHAGLEYHWWTDNSCGAVMREISIQDMAKALSQPQKGGCDQPALVLFGFLSMAGGNVIVCGAMALFLIWAARQKARWNGS